MLKRNSVKKLQNSFVMIQKLLLMLMLLLVLSSCRYEVQNFSDTDNSMNLDSNSVKQITVKLLTIGSISANNPDFETQTLPELVKKEFPQISIISEKLPDQQFMTTLKSRFAAGEGPDIYYYWPINFSKSNKFLITSNYAKDLSNLNILKNFNNSIKEAYSLDGKIYAIPSTIQLLGTYYNKKLFQNAGVNEFPRDWTEFLSVCEKLKKAGIPPIIMGDKDDWVIQFGLYQIAASVVYPKIKNFDIEFMLGKRKFTDKPWKEVLSKYKLLYDKKYIIPGTLGIGSTQAYRLFIDGGAAMIFDGSWNYDVLMEEGKMDFDRGFMPLPGNNKGEPLYLTANPGTGTYVNPMSANQKEIMEILEYWYDGSSQLFNAWKDAYSSQVPAWSGLTLEGAEFKEYNKMLKPNESVGFSNNYWISGVSDELDKQFQGIIAGVTSVEKATKEVEAKTRILQKENG